MLIPVKDNIRARSAPIITISIVVVNIFVFVWFGIVEKVNEASLVARFGFVARYFLRAWTAHQTDIPLETGKIVTAMFLHDGLFHVGGNMLFLWIFGNNVEDALGAMRYWGFYLAGGVCATLSQVSADPTASVPMVGASGAVSGILGAYLVLFPRARVKTVLFLLVFVTTVDIPAVLLLTAWFALQLVFAGSEGVAWFAHIGGFIFGAVTIKLFALGRDGRQGIS
jgi:membrane associated rhomboid family serine protease